MLLLGDQTALGIFLLPASGAVGTLPKVRALVPQMVLGGRLFVSLWSLLSHYFFS